MKAPTVVIKTMNKGKPNEFERAFLYCPNGHEATSSPVANPTGRRLIAGDFSREWCGYGSCEYGSGFTPSCWECGRPGAGWCARCIAAERAYDLSA